MSLRKSKSEGSRSARRSVLPVALFFVAVFASAAVVQQGSPAGAAISRFLGALPTLLALLGLAAIGVAWYVRGESPGTLRRMLAIVLLALPLSALLGTMQGLGGTSSWGGLAGRNLARALLEILSLPSVVATGVAVLLFLGTWVLAWRIGFASRTGSPSMADVLARVAGAPASAPALAAAGAGRLPLTATAASPVLAEAALRDPDDDATALEAVPVLAGFGAEAVDEAEREPVDADDDPWVSRKPILHGIADPDDGDDELEPIAALKEEDRDVAEAQLIEDRYAAIAARDVRHPPAPALFGAEPEEEVMAAAVPVLEADVLAESDEEIAVVLADAPARAAVAADETPAASPAGLAREEEEDEDEDDWEDEDDDDEEEDDEEEEDEDEDEEDEWDDEEEEEDEDDDEDDWDDEEEEEEDEEADEEDSGRRGLRIAASSEVAPAAAAVAEAAPQAEAGAEEVEEVWSEEEVLARAAPAPGRRQDADDGWAAWDEAGAPPRGVARPRPRDEDGDRQEMLFAPVEIDGDLYARARTLVIEEDRCSVAMLQRNLSVSFSEAAALIDRLSEEGVVGPQLPSGRREILVSRRSRERAQST